jgi:predicted ATPase
MKPDSKIVGRETELAVLSSALKSLEGGRGQVLLLSGEPGIGKSTLVHSLADQARDDGLAAYWGFTWEGGGAPSYWPWTQILRSLLKEQTTTTELTAQLGQVLPEFADTANDSMSLQPEQARFQLLEAMRTLLDSASSNTPLLLILEDLHAADNESRHTRHMPILLIGTFRDQEARNTDSTGPLWQTSRDARVLQLQRLSASDVHQYLYDRNGQEPTVEEVQELLATTEGNPLFLSELVALLESGDGLEGKHLPQTVEQVIHQQLERLPDSCLRLMAVASILGREFSHRAIAGIYDATGNDIDDLLAPAITAGVIKPAPSQRYRFFHVLYCDVLQQMLDRSELEILHKRRAGMLQNLANEGHPDRWSQLATHLDASGSEHRAKAITAWQKAAKRYTERLAFEAAESALRKAVNAFGSGPNYAPADRCRLLLELAAATLAKGDIKAGQQLCSDAYAIARTLEDGELMAEAALTWGSVIVVAKINKELVGALEEVLKYLPSEATGLRAKVSARLAAALQPAPDPAEPVQMARDAIELARTTGDQRVIYEVLKYAISAMMP